MFYVHIYLAIFFAEEDDFKLLEETHQHSPAVPSRKYVNYY